MGDCYDAPFIRPAEVKDVDGLNCPEPYCPCPAASIEPVVIGEVEITNWDELPLGIEASLVITDCIANADGEIIGRVGWCKLVDEDSGDISWKKLALLRGEAAGIDFDPAMHFEVDCDAKNCADAAIINVTGDDTAPAIGATANEIQVINTCCDIVIKTSIGEILIPSGNNFHDEYDCPLTIEEITITGDCEKSDIKFTFKNG